MNRIWCPGAVLAVAVVTAVCQTPLSAETWPQRQVRILLPSGAGSGPDVVARLFSAKLAERWNKPVIVENRPGGDGLIGAAAFVAAHDDHTLLYTSSAPISVYPVTRERLPYDPARDIVPISSAASGFFALHASATSQLRSIRELVDRAQSQPGKLTYNAGFGQRPILFQGFLHQQGISMVLVPYREQTLAVQDLMEGRLDVMLSTMTSLLSGVEAGKIRQLAITNTSRSPIAPDVSTVVEQEYPELTAAGLEGFFGWRNIPVVLRDRISEDIRWVAADAALAKQLVAIGYVSGGSTPESFSSALEELHAKMISIAKIVGIKPSP
jgi:tripartite-type tricarboxylate transporter receptor subunit TctC